MIWRAGLGSYIVEVNSCLLKVDAGLVSLLSVYVGLNKKRVRTGDLEAHSLSVDQHSSDDSQCHDCNAAPLFAINLTFVIGSLPSLCVVVYLSSLGILLPAGRYLPHLSLSVTSYLTNELALF